MKKIIGLTGSLGSGCTTTAEHLAKSGYQRISISGDILVPMAREHGAQFTTREEKQAFGNRVRREFRADYKTRIMETVSHLGDKVVIECFRNPIEIDLLRDEYPHFYLFAIYADHDERKQRISEENFEDCDKRDIGERNKLGQQVRKCVKEADIVLNNSTRWKHRDDAIDFFSKVDDHSQLLDEPIRPHTPEETSMHLAYSISLHSLCIQRQVGAVITDGDYRVLSVGYNDVPSGCDSCYDLLSSCYRKLKMKENIRDACKDDVRNCPYCGNDLNFKADLFAKKPITISDSAFVCNSCKKDLLDILRSKHLDYCRALHAEENAILSNPYSPSMSGVGSNMILFSTTFPCMLCAKMIASSGISRVVFVEPYPISESHRILEENDVEIKTFEGVKSLSFNWIFRKRGKYLKDSSHARLKELETITQGE